jgi:hypothetical protein
MHRGVCLADHDRERRVFLLYLLPPSNADGFLVGQEEAQDLESRDPNLYYRVVSG